MTDPHAPWWRPDSHARRRPFLRSRAAILKALRALFDERDFIEVETPALQVCPGMEPHLMAFETRLEGTDGAPLRTLYLHTSPEFAMKKLLVAGEKRIFQFAHAYRNRELSPTHHPEFTMLEWYRSGGSLDDLMDDCEAILRAAANAAGRDHLLVGANEVPLAEPFEQLSVAEAFLLYAGIDILATAPDPYTPERDLLAAEAQNLGLRVAGSDSWEDLFFKISLDRIEPHLGKNRPVFLTDWPLATAALSRPSPTDPRVAERFELYVGGIEIANAFGELTDAAEQRRRFAADKALKAQLYGTTYPIDEDFLAALDWGMAPASGIALGLDRLIMVATGATDIDHVLWAPVAAY